MAGEANVVLRSDALTAEVSPVGAELQRLTTADGHELLWNGDPTVWSGRAPILFPVIGLLNGGRYRFDGRTYALPKHGFARHAAFALAHHDPASATFRLEASDETRAAYPFDFALDIAFTLDGATLTVAASIANRGERPMPASFGFHPALRWPLPFGAERADHRIAFDRDEPSPIRRIGLDGLLTPDPRPTPVVDRELALRDDLFIDDAVIFDRIASRRVTYGGPRGRTISVAFEDFPVLGVWTRPEAGFVCIEPWAGLPDPEGFTGDLTDKPGVFEVAPHGARRLAMSLSLTPPPA